LNPYYIIVEMLAGMKYYFGVNLILIFDL